MMRCKILLRDAARIKTFFNNLERKLNRFLAQFFKFPKTSANHELKQYFGVFFFKLTIENITQRKVNKCFKLYRHHFISNPVFTQK